MEGGMLEDWLGSQCTRIYVEPKISTTSHEIQMDSIALEIWRAVLVGRMILYWKRAHFTRTKKNSNSTDEQACPWHYCSD